MLYEALYLFRVIGESRTLELEVASTWYDSLSFMNQLTTNLWTFALPFPRTKVCLLGRKSSHCSWSNAPTRTPANVEKKSSDTVNRNKL